MTRPAATYDPATMLLARQMLWGQRRGHSLCGSAGARGRLAYTLTLEDNLFQPLTPEARAEFSKGDGGELGQGGTIPGKMQAVHSSSALSCNLFHYWRMIGRPDVIAKACGLPDRNIDSLTFEQHLPIDPAFRFSPNIDALLRYRLGPVRTYAIECKFSEPFSTRVHPGIKARYLEQGIDDLWQTLPNLRAFAKTLCPLNKVYEHLDAAQLIKHVLGLRRCSGEASRLLYLYFDVPGAAGVRHMNEIREFVSIANRDGVVITAATYQDVLLRLARSHRKEHVAYIDYMVERYL